MEFSKGNKIIAIEMHDLLGGKKPGLYVGEGNQVLKVGTFGNEKKAETFREFLEFMFGDLLVNDNKEVRNNDGQSV